MCGRFRRSEAIESGSAPCRPGPPLPRARMNPESRVIPGDGSCHSLQRRLEVRVSRVDVEPLLQDVVRRQLRKLFDDRGVMRTLRADQNAMPLPPPSPGWFDQEHHLTAEQVHSKAAEHPLGEEAGIVLESPHDPFVVERLHRSHARLTATLERIPFRPRGRRRARCTPSWPRHTVPATRDRLRRFGRRPCV